MKGGIGKNKISFAEKNFEIHGEFEGTVYRTKRNGELETYTYEPVSHYQRVPLTIRNEWIRRYATRISNPREADYSEIIRKLNYYTPYILPAGSHKFTAGTVFYVRQWREFEFRWQGSPMGFIQKAGKRTKINLSFTSEGEFVLDCLHEGEVYCERWFIITDIDLDTAYDEWLTDNFAEIVEKEAPEHKKLKTYRRGMRSKRNWIEAIDGAYYDEVLYMVKSYAYKDKKREYPWLYHRRRYDHTVNPQSQKFNEKMKEIGAEWKELSQEEREEWGKKASKNKKKRWTGFNLYARERMRGS